MLEKTTNAEQTALRKRVSQRQKAWKYIRDVNNTELADLSRKALIDGGRTYTYGLMFREWERYASVFSALGMTGEKHARVGLLGSTSAEAVFAIYGLNMVGADVSLVPGYSALFTKKITETIRSERLTDFIITDDFAQANLINDLLVQQKALGLNNVIVLHVPVTGVTVHPMATAVQEAKFRFLKGLYGPICMDELLAAYGSRPVAYAAEDSSATAFITHTSGTTHGTRKLLPFPDKVINDTLKMFPKGFHSFVEGPEAAKPFRILQVFDFSSIMALSAMLLGPLAFGDAVVFTCFGFMHPKFVRAIDYYNIDVVLVTGFMVDKWLDDSAVDGLDFSSLKVVGMSGGYISPEKMERYREFFRSHGCQCDITAGYGMSEAGGKPMFAPKGNDRDILGFEEDSESVRIKDENDGKFYRIEDGPRTGIRYKLSETRSKNELDGEVLFDYTEIDGKPFLCTNDLVRVNEDGSISFAGRADKYFVNNEGRKFDAGVVDLHMAAHPAVDRCAVVPVMEKRIHDTVPVLYVVPTEKGPRAAEAVRGAFVDVYVKEKKIAGDNLPTQFMLVEDIPLNANGKLDIFRITRERLDGEAYDLIPVFADGALTDIRTKHVERVNSMTAGTLPEGMENNSAYNSFDLFNTAPSDGPAFPDILGLLRRITGDGADGNRFKLPEVPENVKKAILKYGNRLSGIPNGRKSIDFDFED